MRSSRCRAIAEELVGHEPGGLAWAWAYFVSGGSEAVEAALKMARSTSSRSASPPGATSSPGAKATTATRSLCRYASYSCGGLLVDKAQ